MAALPLFHTLYGHQQRGAGDAFVINLGRHLNFDWVFRLNGDADMSITLIAIKRKPDISRDILAWALIQ